MFFYFFLFLALADILFNRVERFEPHGLVAIFLSLLRTIQKYQSARVQIAVAEKKNSEQSANNQDRRDFCLSDNCVLSSLKETVIFFLFVSFFAQSFSLRRLLHSVYTVPPDGVLKR